MKNNNTLAFSCPHLPFEHKHFLPFIIQTYKRFKCSTIICLGDLVDNHSISYHEHDPDGWAPAQEMEETDKHLAPWFKAFPKVLMCRGNHDCLVDRKGKTVGLPRRAFKPFRNIWNLPKKWEDEFEHVVDGVLYKHGTGFSGKTGHIKAAEDSRMPTVIGHLHAVLGAEWLVSEKDRIFGMAVGCGVNRKKYAFAYGVNYQRKPVLGCGVILDGGQEALPIPMRLD